MEKNIGFVFLVVVLVVIGSSSYVFGGAEPSGACCQVSTGICTDSVLELDCGPSGQTWHVFERCIDLVPACGTVTTTTTLTKQEIPEYPTAAIPVGIAALGYLAIRRYRKKE